MSSAPLKLPLIVFISFFYYFPYLYIFTLLKLLKILGFSQDAKYHYSGFVNVFQNKMQRMENTKAQQ